MNPNFLYAILTGIIPPIIWLIFWLREDTNPEPRSVIASLFLAGALAVLAAFVGEKYIAMMNYSSNTQYILWAAVEEVLKFIILITVAFHAKSNDEPIDAMMYCITIALGFAALENILSVMVYFNHGNVADGLIFGNLRAIGATLTHTVSTTCVGFMYGYLFYKSKFTKFLGMVLGLAAGIAIHAVFNIAVTSTDSTDILRAFSWMWGAAVIMIILFEEIKLVRPEEI